MSLGLVGMSGHAGCVGDAPDLPVVIEASSTSSSETIGSAAECGNGVAEADEPCDGSDLRGATCESLNEAPGTLACTTDCRFNVLGCVPPGMVVVPAGDFMMGSTAEPDTQPVRQVYVDSFWIGETEVTVLEYSECVAARACVVPTDWVAEPEICNWGSVERVQHPINCVNWYHAESYCAWVDDGRARLPTEAEWEKAARGGAARKYPWGDEPGPICEYAVMINCAEPYTQEVGSNPLGASPYGALDMVGNVAEWVADWYAPIYEYSDVDNPKGRDFGDFKVVRGGSFSTNSLSDLTTFAREFFQPHYAFEYTGFRCVRMPLPR